MTWLAGLLRFLLGLAGTFLLLSAAAYVLLRVFDRLPGHMSLLDFITRIAAVVWDRLLLPLIG